MNAMKETFEEICISSGYEVNQHRVETPDGYLLRLYRIPGRLNKDSLSEEGPDSLTKGPEAGTKKAPILF